MALLLFIYMVVTEGDLLTCKGDFSVLFVDKKLELKTYTSWPLF